jgi:hypothetical protein
MASKRARRWYVALLVIVALYVAYRYTLHRMVEAKLDEVRKQGYPVTLAELDKWYPQVPPGENAADVYAQAFAHYDRWTTNELVTPVSYEPPKRGPHNLRLTSNGWVRVERKIDLLPIVGNAKIPPDSQALSNEVQNLIAEYLSNNAEPLRLLHEGTSVERCRYPVSFSKGVETLLPHLNEVRQGARLLSLDAIMCAAKRESQSVVSSLVAAVALARSLTDEPGIVDQLVRIAVLRIDASCLEGVLNRTVFADAQLRELDAAFTESEPTNCLARAFGCEIAMNIDLFRWPVKRQLTWMLPPPPQPSTFMNGVGYLAPAWYRQAQFYLLKASGLMEVDLLRHLAIMEGYLHLAQLPLPERLAAAKSVDSETRKLPRFCVMSNWLCCYGSGGMSAFVVKDLAATACLRLSRTSLALERYRLTNGKLPDRLDELVPAYLTAVPADPFDGQPLLYKKLVKGYIVYSVGENGKDDGGDGRISERTNWKPADITFTVER